MDAISWIFSSLSVWFVLVFRLQDTAVPSSLHAQCRGLDVSQSWSVSQSESEKYVILFKTEKKTPTKTNVSIGKYPNTCRQGLRPSQKLKETSCYGGAAVVDAALILYQGAADFSILIGQLVRIFYYYFLDSSMAWIAGPDASPKP